LLIYDSQAERLEICVEVTTIDSAPAFFALHNRRECLSVRIIDHSHRARFGGENRKIEIGPLIGSRVFYNNVSMLNPCATGFRFE